MNEPNKTLEILATVTADHEKRVAEQEQLLKDAVEKADDLAPQMISESKDLTWEGE